MNIYDNYLAIEQQANKDSINLLYIILINFINDYNLNKDDFFSDKYIERVLMKMLKIISPQNRMTLLNILKNNNFNFKTLQRQVIRNLAKGYCSPDFLSSFLVIPSIEKICYENNMFKIISSDTSEFSFQKASDYCQNDKIKQYINKYETSNRCHHNTYFLSKYLKDNYSITSLCTGNFKNVKFYHSYCYNQDENIIIDLNSNLVIDKDIYYNLYDPIELSVIQNKNIKKELFITNMHTIQPFNRCPLLKIALYKQKNIEEKEKRKIFK